MSALTEINVAGATAITAPDLADGIQTIAKDKSKTHDIASHKISFTFFKDEFANSMTVKAVTLPELHDLIMSTTGPTKSALPWLKGARFGDKRTKKSSLRHDENVVGFDLIELDYDQGVMSFDEAVSTVKAMNVRALVYTTPSHTRASPRWRILLPISCGDYETRMRAAFCARVNGRFGKIFARESFVPSQSFYYGLALDNLAPDHRCVVIDGRFIDRCDEFYKYQKDGGPDNLAAEGVNAGSALAASQGEIDWAKVNEHAGWLKSVSDLPSDFNAKGKIIVAHDGNLEDLNYDLEQAGRAPEKKYQSWSEVCFALAAILKNHGGYTIEQTAAALLCDLPCNRHITKKVKERDRHRAVERSIANSYTSKTQVQRKEGEPDWRERRNNGSPVPSMHNARIAIAALGVVCRRDTFHHKTLFGYIDEEFKHEVQSVLGEVSDDGIVALRQLMSDRFSFDLGDKSTRDAVVSLALENCFNPVCDEIDKAEAEWDGVKRLDRMAAEYFNCEDTPLNNAFMRKMMIGLVKRAREPGCKFDTIVVLESNEGFNKSSAWRVLAGEENFSDERILGKESREVQEQLSGIWIHENADLAGLKKTDVESVKAYASRQYDIARRAFGHFVTKQARHSIEVGTTNASTYLQSQTGNRRFWPMTVMQPIDIEKLKRDRLQLIGEAARYLTEGESVVLDKLLWGDAGVEQEKRRVKDPWEDTLEVIHQYTTGKYLSDGKWAERQVQIIYYSNAGHDEAGMELVASADLLAHVLDVPVERQTTAHTMRLATIMTRLGWQRHKGGHVRINGKRVSGYFRPEQKPERKPLF
jgi:predicted P-loop ATPase